jgi:hypothetical protein
VSDEGAQIAISVPTVLDDQPQNPQTAAANGWGADDDALRDMVE